VVSCIDLLIRSYCDVNILIIGLLMAKVLSEYDRTSFFGLNMFLKRYVHVCVLA
jgi:hypothetical protein